MRMIAIVLCALMLLLPIVAQAEELPLRDTSEVKDWFASNPRNVKDIGDPFVLTEDSGYYMFATGGPIGFNVWRSTDLITFDKAKALKKLDWASGDYWAPEVYKVGERYVMLYTARYRENGSLRTGIAFADAPEGPYEDPLGKPLMDYGYATIDATLTWDDTGSPYLIYVRDCSENSYNGHQESHIYGVRLADDLLSTIGDPVLLLQPEGEWETKSGDTRWNEGPVVVRHDGKYYLFYSVNGYWMKEYSFYFVNYIGYKNIMKSYIAKPDTIKRDWYVVDAEGKTLGRLATEIATRLRGKHKPEYTPFMDTGDYVIVINAAKVVVTGNKTNDKMYHSHSGFPGGIKSLSFKELIASKPEKVIESAVHGMLPKGPLGRAMFRKLKVYAGATHDHAAQQPKVLDI